MASAKKIAFIGATSTYWNPGMMANFVRDAAFLEGSTLMLYGRQPSTLLDGMTALGQRMIRESEANVTIEKTCDRRELLDGADFVIAAFTVGTTETWLQDLEIPLKYDVRQTVGDSLGPGGIFRALRHIPYLVKYAQEMEELCPDAYLFNYINPLSANTRSIWRYTKIKAVGLCRAYAIAHDIIAKTIGVPANEINIVEGGLNHCSWCYDVRFKDGSDAYPALRKAAPAGTEKISADLLEQFGYWPVPCDMHVYEFFPWFHRRNSDPNNRFDLDRLDIMKFEDARVLLSSEHKAGITKRILEEGSGKRELEDWTFAEMAIDIIAAMASDRKDTHYVNVPNNVMIPNLPQGAVVEVPAMVDALGIHPIAVGPLPASVVGHSQRECAKHELMVEAAMEGDKKKVLQAFALDPYTDSLEDAKSIMSEMFEAGGDLLPSFQ